MHSLALPPDMVSIADYEQRAFATLDPSARAYLFGGSADEITLARNRADLDALTLTPRVLADLRGASTEVSLFGRSYTSPVFLGPVGHQKLFHPRGEADSAMAAAAMETPFVVSAHASTRFAEIVAAGEGQEQWFQLYWQGGRAETAELLARAEAAGFTTLVVTVDAPVNGIRNREHRAGFAMPPHAQAVNIAAREAPSSAGGHPVFDRFMQAAPGWDDMHWLRRLWRKPLLIKGVMTRADALHCLEVGVDGIVVSNHGGRALDGAPSAISALPLVAEAVGGRVPLLFDGGVRRGADVVKAIALGASAIFLGRAYAAALACAGARGVVHALKLIQEEMAVTMALTGTRSLCRATSDTDFAGLVKMEGLRS